MQNGKVPERQAFEPSPLEKVRKRGFLHIIAQERLHLTRLISAAAAKGQIPNSPVVSSYMPG